MKVAERGQNRGVDTGGRPLGRVALPCPTTPIHREAAVRTATLGPVERVESLAAMAARELDVLVVGAGVVGAGMVLDAATRGLTTGLV
ncbi:hypothetical protein SALBM311S_10800 [Streptomyces alboniger]